MDKLESLLMGGFSAGMIYIFGGNDTYFQVLGGAIVCNFITGTCFAILKKQLTHERVYEGLFRIMVVLMAIYLANRLDQTTTNPTHFLRNSVLIPASGYYIQSFIKNAAALNFPFFKKLATILGEFTIKGGGMNGR